MDSSMPRIEEINEIHRKDEDMETEQVDTVYYRTTNEDDRVRIVTRTMGDVVLRAVNGKGGLRAVSAAYFADNFRREDTPTTGVEISA